MNRVPTYGFDRPNFATHVIHFRPISRLIPLKNLTNRKTAGAFFSFFLLFLTHCNTLLGEFLQKEAANNSIQAVQVRLG